MSECNFCSVWSRLNFFVSSLTRASNARFALDLCDLLHALSLSLSIFFSASFSIVLEDQYSYVSGVYNLYHRTFNSLVHRIKTINHACSSSLCNWEPPFNYNNSCVRVYTHESDSVVDSATTSDHKWF